MHFQQKDVESFSTSQNNDVGGLKLSLKLSPDNGGGLSYYYSQTYARGWKIRKGKPIPSRYFPKVTKKFLVGVVCEKVEMFWEGQPLPHVEMMCFTTHKRDEYIYHAHPDCCHRKTW
jgi:hypothetical protein